MYSPTSILTIASFSILPSKGDTVDKLRSALSNYTVSSEADLGILIYYVDRDFLVSNHARVEYKIFLSSAKL